MSGIEKSYIDGVAMHVKDPVNSIIATLTYEEYLAMPQDKLHELLQEKNVVVTGAPVPDHQFDAKGLEFVHPLHSTVPIQGSCLVTSFGIHC